MHHKRFVELSIGFAVGLTFLGKSFNSAKALPPVQPLYWTQVSDIAPIQADLTLKPIETLPKKETPVVAPQKAVVAGCGDNMYAQFIYSHESGCNLNAVNSQGCRGIGQACPGSKLPCGADYACQNAYFTAYALNRYGSWAAAYSYWIGHNYW